MTKFEEIKKSKTAVLVFWYESVLFTENDPVDQFLIFDSLKKKFKDKLRIIKIDVFKDLNKKLSDSEKIRKFPTIQLYSNGLELLNIHGFVSEDELVDSVLDSYAHTHDNKLNN